MTPQLSVQQLEHAIKNLQRRVDAKKLEAHSYKELSDHSPSAFGTLSMILPADASAQDDSMLIAMAQSLGKLREATVNLFTAKLNQALIDLEELELQLKAVKQMSSGIVVPGMQINQNKRG